MEWRHSGSPRAKNSECKSAGKYLAAIFWDQESTLIIDYLPKGQTIKAEYYSSMMVQLKDILKETPAGSSPSGSCSCATRLKGTCNPEETGLSGLPMSWSPTLFSGYGPVGLPPVPWIEKNNWKVAIFRPKRRSLLTRRPGWTDKILNLFEWFAKVRAKGVELYWASWGVCLINPDIGRCCLFPSWSG